MPVTKYAFSRSSRQEAFSVAYIKAIAAAAGYSVSPVGIDENSIDLNIEQKTPRGDRSGHPLYELLRVQAKCTYSHQPGADGFIRFRLPVETYDRLRKVKSAYSLILVVLCIPDADEASWLEEHPECMTLYKSAHWISLRGAEESNNKETITVLLPVAQRFGVEGLRGIMDSLARGELI